MMKLSYNRIHAAVDRALRDNKDIIKDVTWFSSGMKKHIARQSQS